MATFQDLAERMRALNVAIPVKVGEALVGIATALELDLVAQTPVDTSRALSNWRVSIGAPETDWIDPHVWGRKGSTALQSYKIAVSIFTDIVKTRKPGEPIFIVNNTPYILELNAGSSLQAPPGFVDMIIARHRRSVKNVKLKLEANNG